MFDALFDASQLAIRNVDTYRSFAENQLARAAVTRLYSSRPESLFGSVTFIHGPAGVGKSHLALWTLKELHRKHPKAKFAYTSAKTISEMVQYADEQQSLAEFLEQCRSLDVLVCEDLEWLSDVPSSQPFFMMLINALADSLTQVLLTARRPVGELRPIDQRLVSRCHGGLCVAMPMLSLHTRVQLLQHWFQELRLPILKPLSACAQFLAERLPVTPRELRATVLNLASQQTRQRSLIDVAYLENWLKNENRAPRLSFESIVCQVAHEFGVDPADLRSRSRQQGLAVPRQCAMWLARELTGRPLDQIGQYFDRSHTTVSHSLARLRDLLPSIPALRHQVQKLRHQLNELPREDCA